MPELSQVEGSAKSPELLNKDVPSTTSLFASVSVLALSPENS